MTKCLLPKARPISCNDCPAVHRHHISLRWFTESFTRLRCIINTTFRENIPIRWCCIDRLSWHDLSGTTWKVVRRHKSSCKSRAASPDQEAGATSPGQLPPVVKTWASRGRSALYFAKFQLKKMPLQHNQP